MQPVMPPPVGLVFGCEPACACMPVAVQGGVPEAM